MSTEPSTWSRLSDLEIAIDEVRTEPRSLKTASGFVRRTTVVEFRTADGAIGRGEDVTWDAKVQLARSASDLEPLRGFRGTLAEASAAFAQVTERSAPGYLRWALESAALDLALVRDGRSLGEVVGREPRPVRFCVSLGLGAKPDAGESLAALDEVLAADPDARFKVDFSEHFTPRTAERLAASGRVDVLDLKAHDRGDFQGPAPDAALYAALAEALPDAWLEDPLLEGEARAALAGAIERVTWDAPFDGLAWLTGLEHEPRAVNVKPSRFGTLAELFAVLDHCAARGIACYGGGQFELGVGRRQIQELAALWYPDGPNDVSPVAYHPRPLAADAPRSPLAVRGGHGFGGSSDLPLGEGSLHIA